jgi:hypothetical protein
MKRTVAVVVSALALVAGCAHIQRVDVDQSGRQAPDGVFEPPALDDRGDVVVFTSPDFLTADDQVGVTDVFDRYLGAQRTELDSIAPDGSQDAVGTSSPAISGDGRYVAYTSASGGPLPIDPSALGTDLYVHDRLTGDLRRVVIPGHSEGFSTGDGAVLDGDGGEIAFVWSDVRPGPASLVSAAWVMDLRTGDLRPASVGTDGVITSGQPTSMSGDGRFVAFTSTPAAIEGRAGDTSQQVFVRDLDNDTTEQASVAADGTELTGSYDGVISGDGSSMALWQTAPPYHVFRKDLTSGAVTPVDVRDCRLVAPSVAIVSASINGDGRVVAFSSASPDLVSGLPAGDSGVFVWRADHPCSSQLVSSGRHGQRADGDSYWPDVSGDGRSVGFVSSATNLVASDTNGHADAFVWSLSSGAHRLDDS